MFGLKGATFFARGIQTWNSGIGGRRRLPHAAVLERRFERR